MPSDERGCTHSIAFILTDAINTSALSDLSEKDKPWDKHRRNSDKVANYYQRTEEFNQYAQRINFCSQLLDFKLTPDVDVGELKLKLANVRFCRVRHCPVCQWRRSLMWKAKAYQTLPKIIEAFPKHRWLFLTLTVRNCVVTELKQTLQWMNKSWQRLIQRKIFPAVGWLRSTEVTRGEDRTAHPHFHCLLLVPSSYFGKNYIKRAQWVDLWRGCLKVDYSPILDVRAIRKDHHPTDLISEILKYCVKESDMVGDREWFLELTRQMHKMKCVTTGGVLKSYFKSLENEPEDLIGKDEDDVLVDEGHLYFGWKKREQKYKLID